MTDLTDFLEARMQEWEAQAQRIVAERPLRRALAIDRIVSVRGLINLHSAEGHNCPGRDSEYGRVADYEQDCPTLMLLAYPYRHHKDWRGEWKA